ncbi:YihY/virulence factor BrkB family protein [Bacillus xiapuensis]|uniref:YihY/virulence factor BrkB family protein n=1 Tax=Bacillus xiapuensis TaxID=2014075 RepID=UPI001E658DFA|nr:YihY/virulence factor BrkB family protein [Bacillus xiapuensis]
MKYVKLIKRIAVRFFAERFFDQAAQTAYYLLLSVIPFLIFMLSLLSFLPVKEGDILGFVKPYAPADTAALIQENVQAILKRDKAKILSVSFLSTLWLSSMAIQSLVRSLNDAYNVQKRLSFFAGLLRDLGVTLIFMFLVPLSWLIPLAEEFLHQLLFDGLSFYFMTWTSLKWGLGTVFLFLFFIVFYKVLPNGKQPLRSVMPGALFAAVGWQAVSVIFGEYAGIVNYSRIYGQLSGIIILTLWFYLTAAVLLLGGLINVERVQNGKPKESGT